MKGMKRRDFLLRSGGVLAMGSAGLEGLRRVVPAEAAAAAVGPEMVRFRPEIEPVVRWIEQTAIMLALPYLESEDGVSTLQGRFDYSGKLRDDEIKGSLSLIAGEGRISIQPTGEQAERNFRIRSLGSDRYALVTTIGILPLAISESEPGLRLQAYSTRRHLGNVLVNETPVLSIDAVRNN